MGFAKIRFTQINHNKLNIYLLACLRPPNGQEFPFPKISINFTSFFPLIFFLILALRVQSPTGKTLATPRLKIVALHIEPCTDVISFRERVRAKGAGLLTGRGAQTTAASAPQLSPYTILPECE